MKTLLITLCLLITSIYGFSQESKLGKLLTKQLSVLNNDDETVVFIYFTDKGSTKQFRTTLANSIISQRSINRRMKVRGMNNIIDEQDRPLDRSYVQTISNQVVKVRHELKWFNALSVVATKAQIDVLRNFPFVKEIELVGRWKKRIGDEEEQNIKYPETSSGLSGTTSLDYGTSYTQVNQIKVPQVHNLGIYGQGVVVGVFDNGFRILNHESFSSMNIIAQHDFIDHKESVIPNNDSVKYGSHGVNTLSTIGGYKPGQLIGPAFKADYILARTENDSSETPIEEDYWAAAIQWADSIGVDVTSTSLSYLTYDSPYTSWTWADMDGNTTLITKAADRAVELGIIVVVSAGNAGAGDGIHNTLGGPADGDSVITAGAVDSFDVRVSFSSVGPTTDVPLRIKPDVMAMGRGVRVASSTNTTGYGRASGTSFSCPLTAGVAALILSSNPTLTPIQVREAMRQTASNAASPSNLLGWGILNADSAIKYYGALPIGRISGNVFNDLNGNGVQDAGEPIISGRSIHLTGTITDSTITNAEGNYFFDSLAIGTYTMTEEIPTGWIETYPRWSHAITLFHGIDTTGFDFGNVYLPDTGINIDPGWHLLSSPYLLMNTQKNLVYPNISSDIFIYQNSYIPLDTVPLKIGYWGKFDSPTKLFITGMPRLSDTIDVQAGWNIIGGLSVPIPIDDIMEIPVRNVISEYFLYDKGFYAFVTTLLPYFGYWVKVQEDGILIFNGLTR